MQCWPTNFSSFHLSSVLFCLLRLVLLAWLDSMMFTKGIGSLSGSTARPQIPPVGQCKSRSLSWLSRTRRRRHRLRRRRCRCDEFDVLFFRHRVVGCLIDGETRSTPRDSFDDDDRVASFCCIVFCDWLWFGFDFLLVFLPLALVIKLQTRLAFVRLALSLSSDSSVFT